MQTYYDLLDISPEATESEIQVAYEQLYNHWRRLVTHHDPDTVNQANQALQQLEKMRTTLADPARREAYDAGIGLRGSVGGLADVEAKPREGGTILGAASASQPPKPRPGPREPPVVGERVDAWVCPECLHANPIGTRHCTNCGHQLGVECPNPDCRTLTQATATYCPGCGANIPEMRQQREVIERQKAKERENRQKQIQEMEMRVRTLSEQKQRPKTSSREILGTMALLLGAIFTCLSGGGILDDDAGLGMFLLLCSFGFSVAFYLLVRNQRQRNAPILKRNEALDSEIQKARAQIAQLRQQVTE